MSRRRRRRRHLLQVDGDEATELARPGPGKEKNLLQKMLSQKSET